MNSGSVIRPPSDAPVFLDETGRRARLLRVAGALVVGLVSLWVIAIAAGLMGLGHLPGVPLLGDSGEKSQQPAAKPSKQAAPTPSSAAGPAARRGPVLEKRARRTAPSAAPQAPSANRTLSSPSRGNGNSQAGTRGNSGQAPAVGRPTDPGSQSQAAPQSRAPATNPGATAPGRSNANSRNPNR